ncbi:LAGLIDADG family homing endonuclease [Streptomyces sp. KM273126]|uniref:LAGLIDADG family homing endonuclease n=1 Tax=Streptomyces sp. KM273126 TaxID=2545247 RepID=UPI00103CC19A|nr:LAGLIDADG family homing endonuclease [Streptomyces sp. KM273126]MBA2808164.1 LAGLIDADG family homing endonuclease [Streptomyces sp. KM273126]
MDLRVPEYAYMFGFLQADGHLYQGAGQKGRLTVELNVRDIDLLHRFKYLTPYNSSVTERSRSTNFAENQRSAVWSVCSLDARTKLNELGLPYGRKSKNITPPRVEFSRRDYLRGVIDADGSVGFTKPGLPFISLTTASTAIVAYLCFYARKITSVERRPRRNQRDDIYNITYITEAAQALCEHLYYPDCLSLRRKQTAAESVMNWVRPAGSKPRPPRIHWTRDMDRTLLAAPTVAEAAVELNFSRSACQVRRWKLLNGVVPLPD